MDALYRKQDYFGVAVFLTMPNRRSQEVFMLLPGHC